MPFVSSVKPAASRVWALTITEAKRKRRKAHRCSAWFPMILRENSMMLYMMLHMVGVINFLPFCHDSCGSWCCAVQLRSSSYLGCNRLGENMRKQHAATGAKYPAIARAIREYSRVWDLIWFGQKIEPPFRFLQSQAGYLNVQHGPGMSGLWGPSTFAIKLVASFMSWGLLRPLDEKEFLLRQLSYIRAHQAIGSAGKPPTQQTWRSLWAVKLLRLWVLVEKSLWHYLVCCFAVWVWLCENPLPFASRIC